MTNQEAINLIDNLKGMIEDNHNSDYDMAFNMAITALEQEPKSETVTEFADRCRECGAKYGKLLKQEPCEDCISRAQALSDYADWFGYGYRDNSFYKHIKNMPSIQLKPKTGYWIYDETIENWRCSKCNETPKTMGYVGTADFMAEHFKFCNHCGCRMVEPQESEDKE